MCRAFVRIADRPIRERHHVECANLSRQLHDAQFIGTGEAGNALTRSFSILWSLCFEEQFYLVMAVVFLFFRPELRKMDAGPGGFVHMLQVSVCVFFGAFELSANSHDDAFSLGRDCVGLSGVGQARPGRTVDCKVQVALVRGHSYDGCYPWIFPSLRANYSISGVRRLWVFSGDFYSSRHVGLLCQVTLDPDFGNPSTHMKLGQCSYEVYLIHGLIIWILTRQSEIQSVWSAVMTMAVSILAGWVFYQFVGSPLRRKVLELYGSTKLRSIELRSGQA